MSHGVTAWAAAVPGAPVTPTRIRRRDPGPNEVTVRVQWCGVCATDRHTLNAGDPATFPLVAGHEIVGEVAIVGAGVTDLTVGDVVAVGNIVDSCRECDMCRAGRENWCRDGVTLTYAGIDRIDGKTTQGGFATEYVLDRRFTHRLPAGLDPAGAAPLLCAGTTVWVPLRRWGAGSGRRVGVIGLGGLGHIAVKLAHALGAETTAFTTSAAKAQQASELGADHVVVSTETGQLTGATTSLDLIIDTVGVPHDLGPYLQALDVDGTLVLVGIPPEKLPVAPMDLVVGAKTIAGAGSGGTAETRAMLDFCASHDIVADVERITPDQLNDAFHRLDRNDVRYRFVVDVATTRDH